MIPVICSDCWLNQGREKCELCPAVTCLHCQHKHFLRHLQESKDAR